MDSQVEQLQAQVAALQATIDAAYEMLLTNPIQQKDTVTISKALDILKPREPMLVDHRFWTDPANAPKPQAIATTPAAPADSAIVAIQAMIARGALPYCPIHGEKITERVDGTYGCPECDWQAQKPVHKLYPASQPAPQAGRYVPIRYELQEYEYRDDDGNLQPALGLYASDAGEFVTTFNIEDRERMQPEVDRMNAEAQAAADSLNAGEQGGGE